jgi:hypothetical protein
MSQRWRRVGPTGRDTPGVVGTVATRLGLLAVAVTLPVVVGTVAGMVGDAATVGAAFDTVGTVLTGPLAGQSGTAWLFHVAVLGLCSGCWLVGAGLVVDGLRD